LLNVLKYGKGFFYKKDTDRWIFGKFQDGKCTTVLERGTGIPLEQLRKRLK